ncbi:hypothetical protein KJ059_12260 [Myxococcota bacterium]|nr:hypothetical protein [Myxococcota bacterium]MCZ7619647.1 hypothetical protein [Myxococcota bacterium]
MTGAAGLPPLSIPAIAELATWRRWVLHDNKEPITVRGSRASTTKPSTWASFEEVADVFVRGLGDGVGFVFTETPFAGIDLDHVVDDAGNVSPEAQAIVDRFASYTELSTSRTGLHILVRGELAGRGRKRGPIECYDRGRYFVMTGRHASGTPDRILDRGEILRAWVAETFGVETSASRAAACDPIEWNGELPDAVAIARDVDATVRLLLSKAHRALGYASASEADFALGCRLAEAAFPVATVEAALRWRHRHVEPRPKSVDYFARTAQNAVGHVTARNEEAG